VGPSDDWPGFWRVLGERLREKYGAQPVHSLEEITSLTAKFPAAIRLLTATVNGEIAAGAALYESTQVVRAQYLATNADARAYGLLDLVLQAAIEDARRKGKWFDFGGSTQHGGSCLNDGLVRYKESFGGRTVVQDSFRLDIT
jgi:lipid II:glycine glycyltransferase (peptidoglycan interpeptide bridge formation enzyme)